MLIIEEPRGTYYGEKMLSDGAGIEQDRTKQINRPYSQD